jgi:predicted HNH restriction endonuclease
LKAIHYGNPHKGVACQRKGLLYKDTTDIKEEVTCKVCITRIKKSEESWKSSKGQIVSALRKIWLRSPERRHALKAEGYTCEECNVKQSKAKGKEQVIEVHHKEGRVDWEYLVEEIRRVLLVHPDKLQVLCPNCHDKLHRYAEVSNANNSPNRL